MGRVVYCTFVSTVPEFSSVVLAVGVNDGSRYGLAWGSAAQNERSCIRLNEKKFYNFFYVACFADIWSDPLCARKFTVTLVAQIRNEVRIPYTLA
jgi:hypothetical protein